MRRSWTGADHGGWARAPGRPPGVACRAQG